MVEAGATQLDYYGVWPGSMERQIEESIVRAAQDEGPPDWVAGQEENIVAYDDEATIRKSKHQTRHSGGVFNSGMRLCWNGKYGGSWPTSVWDIEHGTRPTRTLRAAPGGDTTGRAACQGSSL